MAKLLDFGLARPAATALSADPRAPCISCGETNPRHSVNSCKAATSLWRLAVCAGFSPQSQFSHHFKRVVGITPGRFRMPARIA